MNANDRFFARDAKVDSAAVAPLPASRKIYVQGSRADMRVPMREISQSDTPASFGRPSRIRRSPCTTHPGPTPTRGRDRHPQGTGAAARSLDRRARRHRRACRAHVGVRPGAPGRSRARRAAFRPPPAAAAREAGRQRHADALRAPGHRDAGDGVRRDPREPAARGDGRAVSRERAPAARRAELRRGDPRRRSRPSSCATKSRAAARSFRATSTTRKPSR